MRFLVSSKATNVQHAAAARRNGNKNVHSQPTMPKAARAVIGVGVPRSCVFDFISGA